MHASDARARARPPLLRGVFLCAGNLTSLVNDAFAYAPRGAPPPPARSNNCVLVDVQLRGWPVVVLLTATPLAQGEELLARRVAL